MLHFPHRVRLWLYSELTLQNILPGGWLGSQDAGWRLYTFWKTCKRCTAKMVPFTKLGPVFPHIMKTCLCSLLVWGRRAAHIGETAKSSFPLGHANMENFVFQIAKWAWVLAVSPTISEFPKDAHVSVQTALPGWPGDLLGPSPLFEQLSLKGRRQDEWSITSLTCLKNSEGPVLPKGCPAFGAMLSQIRGAGLGTY